MNKNLKNLEKDLNNCEILKKRTVTHLYYYNLCYNRLIKSDFRLKNKDANISADIELKINEECSDIFNKLDKELNKLKYLQ
jgi:hypothetical protein